MAPYRFNRLGVIPYQRTGEELVLGAAAAPHLQCMTTLRFSRNRLDAGAIFGVRRMLFGFRSCPFA
jgi:hypothetical protein